MQENEARRLENAVLVSQLDELGVWVEELCKRLASERADLVRLKRWGRVCVNGQDDGLDGKGEIEETQGSDTELEEVEMRQERTKQTKGLLEGLSERLAWCRDWAVRKHKTVKHQTRRELACTAPHG